MELHYGLKQPLRLHTNLEHRNNYKIGGGANVFKLISPLTHLLPFQLKRSTAAIGIQSIKYVNTTTLVETEIVSNILAGQIEILHFVSHDRIIHFGSVGHSAALTAGTYYLKISDGITTWYSDDIDLIDFNPMDLATSDCVKTKVTYWDTCNIDDIYYNTVAQGLEQYKNIFYLDVDIGAPEYEYAIEGDEDAETQLIPEYLKLEKKYTLQGVFPEYFVDALSLLPIHIKPSATVNVLTYRGYSTDLSLVTMSPSWIAPNKTWAVTDIEFIAHTVLQTNCCDDVETVLDTCVYADAEVFCTIISGSANHTNLTYDDDTTGLVTAIPDLSYVLIKETAGHYTVRQLSGGLFVFAVLVSNPGEVIGDANQINGTLTAGQEYYYTDGISVYDVPRIVVEIPNPSSPPTRVVYGTSWSGSVVSLWAKLSAGPDVLIGQVDGATLNTSGYAFDRPALATEIYFVAAGLTCTLGTSTDYTLLAEAAVGIGTMQLPNAFGPATNVVG